jgi:hypothetical protein
MEIKNLFSFFTQKIEIRESKYFQVLLVISYIFILFSLYPVGKELLRSIFYLAIFIAYFLPYLISNIKKHPSEAKIFWINLLAGWLIIPWIILLIISIEFKSKRKKSKN